jgi:hypothetical protein
MDNGRQEFIEATTAYVMTHPNYHNWTKEEAIKEALSVMVNDIGAAQHFIYAIGLTVDLYGER